MQDPIRVILDSSYTWKTVRHQRKLVEEKHEFFYLPILEVIQQMLLNDIIYEEVKKFVSILVVL